jgi:hypothetical protein
MVGDSDAFLVGHFCCHRVHLAAFERGAGSKAEMIETTKPRLLVALARARRMPASRLLSVLQLEVALVLIEEGPQRVGGVEQPHPLLEIERDREAPEPINADAALLAHFKFEPDALPNCLPFKLCDAGEQLFFCGF